MEVINLNLIPTGALPVVHASQYDDGRTFRANLMDGSVVYTLDGTEVLECDVKKPDGNIVTVAVTNTSDSYVEIDTTLQMCACAGESLAELHITKGAQEIGTLNFILAVERSPLENGIQSDSGIHNLQTQIGDAVAEQYDAADVVFDAAPVAGHGTGFAVTSEGVKTYVDGEIAALTIPEKLDDLTDVTITTPSDDEILVYDNGEWVNKSNPASTANFAADYDENSTYNTGDIVIYNNDLYEATADSITGTWDPTNWTQITVGTAIGDIKTDVGDLSTLTTSVKSSLAGAVNEVNGNLGNRLVGAWTADTSSANNTYLTDEITVTAGTYLIIMSYPDISSTTFVASLFNKTNNAVYDNCYMFAQSLGTKAVLTAFSGTTNICIASAQSGACNFSNKGRGGIRAVKLSNLF